MLEAGACSLDGQWRRVAKHVEHGTMDEPRGEARCEPQGAGSGHEAKKAQGAENAMGVGRDADIGAGRSAVVCQLSNAGSKDCPK